MPRPFENPQKWNFPLQPSKIYSFFHVWRWCLLCMKTPNNSWKSPFASLQNTIICIRTSQTLPSDILSSITSQEKEKLFSGRDCCALSKLGSYMRTKKLGSQERKNMQWHGSKWKSQVLTCRVRSSCGGRLRSQQFLPWERSGWVQFP